MKLLYGMLLSTSLFSSTDVSYAHVRDTFLIVYLRLTSFSFAHPPPPSTSMGMWKLRTN